MKNTFIFSAETKDVVVARLLRFLDRWPEGMACKIEAGKYVKTRSNQQNKYLWSIYQMILDTGELEGWTKDDLHDFFLIDHFGAETIEGFGRKRLKALKRSSKLTTVEFMDFVGHIQQFMAERGVYIPDPDEEFNTERESA